MGKEFAGFEDIEDGLRFLLRDIDPDFLHCFDHEGIERSRLEAGALGIEGVAAKMIEPRFGHLAPGAVVNADEKDVWLHHHKVLSALIILSARTRRSPQFVAQ